VPHPFRFPSASAVIRESSSRQFRPAQVATCVAHGIRKAASGTSHFRPRERLCGCPFASWPLGTADHAALRVHWKCEKPEPASQDHRKQSPKPKALLEQGRSLANSADGSSSGDRGTTCHRPSALWACWCLVGHLVAAIFAGNQRHVDSLITLPGGDETLKILRCGCRSARSARRHA
jgi:hypothetical protein